MQYRRPRGLGGLPVALGLCCLGIALASEWTLLGQNGSTVLNVSRSFLESGHIVGPRGLDVWFREAEQKHSQMADWERAILKAGRTLEPGTPSYLDWLSRRSSYESRALTRFALILEDVSLQTARRIPLTRDEVGPQLNRLDITAAAIAAQCPVPIKEPCRAAQFRTFSGQCNNVENPHWGKALTPFSRMLPNAYADGLLTPRVGSDGKPLPSAKEISDAIHKDVDMPHKHVSNMLPVWAQLIEQDVAKSSVYGSVDTESPISCCHISAVHPECFPIIDGKDLAKLQSGNVTCLNYVRSATTPSAGCRLGERQQSNSVSHWLDGSPIYGAEEGFHSFFDDHGLLWLDGKGLPQELGDISGCYKPNMDLQSCLSSHASKVRGSGFTPLLILKTLLMREHNRVAKELHTVNPHWDSAILFQQTRSIVIAAIQHITFKEYLPLLVGSRSLDKHHLRLLDHDYFKNYSLTVNANVDSATAAAALKFWHKLMNNRILHAQADGSRTTTLLSKELFRESLAKVAGGFDGYLRGMVQQPSQQKGAGVADQLTKSWMQGPEDLSGLDLVALTIQQGRDHGVPGYNVWRKHCGLSKAESFADLEDVIPADVVKRLAVIYKSTDDIDLYTGGLSERPMQGAMVGPVFACMLSRQFSKLRRGDRFWYEADVPPSRLSSEQLSEIRKITLSRLICDNADNIATIQPQAFLQADQSMNAEGACLALPQVDLTKWREDKPVVASPVSPHHYRRPAVNGTDEPDHGREKRQAFNVRQNRQLQPVNQLRGNGGFNDNTCGESKRNCDPAQKFRTVSGFCNNLNNPDFGTIDRVFSRFTPAAYDDGFGEMRQASVVGGTLPPVRAVRTSVLTDVDRPHPKYTTMLMVFGQFIDHDMTNTPMASGNNGAFLSCASCNSQQSVNQECRPIRVPQGDPVMASFDQRGTPLCLSFTRSQSRRGSDGRRQQVNQLSSFLDGGNIYGTNLCSTRGLRAFVDGRMSMTRSARGLKDLLPQSTNRNDVESSECRSTGQGNLCFRAGDARSNEQPGLSVMHTIWAREHNLIAGQLKSLNPRWDDQRLFDEARRINIAVLQHITYNEWIPRVVGRPVTNLFGLSLLKNGFYRDYDDSCDATISNEFSTAAFRFGHSLVPASYGRYDNTFTSNRFKPLNLFEHFSRSDALYEDFGVDRLLIGFTIEPTQNADFSFARALSDMLFKDSNKALGTDLVAINLARGRDHGLAGYNAYRERCNMTRAANFDDLLGDIPKFLVDKLAQLYRHVDDIDLFAGGMTELPVIGGLVGPTFACIIAEQFLRLRKCDRFWYETEDPNLKFSKAQLASIRKTTMAKVVCQNSDSLNQVQREVFEQPDTFQNTHVGCDEIPELDLSPWQEVSGCSISGNEMAVGETKRVSPCISCACTANGPDCRSLSIKSCADLAQDFTQAQILADDVCKVQCSKDFFDSAKDDDPDTKFSFSS